MTDEQLILIDEPAEHVRRVTLNRPDKRNAISAPLRVALLGALHGFDRDPDVRVTIVRGAGVCFSSGYDLSGKLTAESNTREQCTEPCAPWSSQNSLSRLATPTAKSASRGVSASKGPSGHRPLANR